MEKLSSKKIERTLISYGIDISKWGKGDAKTLEHLENEIKEKESLLIKNGNEILRQVSVVAIDIYYESEDGRKFKLQELKQVFNDGRERYRKIRQSVSEKIKTDEKPKEAMVRGIEEELGVKITQPLIEGRTIEKKKESASYPGLNSKYIIHIYNINFNKEQYKENGYIENQPDKTTYFIWEEVV